MIPIAWSWIGNIIDDDNLYCLGLLMMAMMIMMMTMMLTMMMMMKMVMMKAVTIFIASFRKQSGRRMRKYGSYCLINNLPLPSSSWSSWSSWSLWWLWSSWPMIIYTLSSYLSLFSFSYLSHFPWWIFFNGGKISIDPLHCKMEEKLFLSLLIHCPPTRVTFLFQ